MLANVSLDPEYKLYIGHIHTLVLTREWIARLGAIETTF